MTNLTLFRLECALSPNAAPKVETPVECAYKVKGKTYSYWRSGNVVATTKDACIRLATEVRASWGNVPASLLRIPWC